MKNLLTISALIISIYLKAQPALTDANTNPVIGDIFNWALSYCPTSPGNSGQNQTWDFSSLTTINNSVENVILPSSAIHGPDFPTANICISSKGLYYFYQAGEDSLVYLGGGSYSWEQINSNNEIYLTYPFLFNSSDTDYYKATYNNTGTITDIVGTVTINADGYGTLKLPTGNYTNVLRIKKTENEIKTTNGSSVTITKTKYLWHLPGIHQPVLELTYYNNGNSTAKYLTNISEIEEYKYENFIFCNPNPAFNIITINTNIISQIEILSLQGQLIKTINATQPTTTIDISSLARGMYFIKAANEKGVAVRKFVKE